jgi:asparagine synthase (glutamine-hydrolysing)
MFAGYNRHVLAPAMWRRIARLPRPIRDAASKAILAVPRSGREGLGRLLLGARGRAGDKLDKATHLLGSAANFDQLYEGFLDEWHGERSPVSGFELDRYRISDVSDDPLIRATYADAVGYLPDDILCKVDRASMAVSLETRVPFLDHRVAQVAARIPTSMKVHGGLGKQVLRTLLYRHAPRELFDRPKAGFAVPVGEWIKGPLREWAEELLDPRRLRDGGIFDPLPVRERWSSHLSGRRDSTPALWAVLMFQAWQAEHP